MLKQSHLRMIALVLCLVMMFSLAACGGANDEADLTPEPQAESEYAYKSEFTKISTSAEWGITPAVFTDDGFFATGMEKVGRMEVPEGQTEEYEGQYDIYGSILYFVSYDGKAERLPNFVPTPPEENTEGYRDFNSYHNFGKPAVNSEGKLVALEDSYTGWYDGPDDAYGSDESWNYYQYREEYSILILDTDGTELSRQPVNYDTSNAYINSYSAICDANDNLLVTSDQKILAIAPDGEIAYMIDCQNYVDNLIRTQDGTVAVMTYGNLGPELCPVDLETRSLGSAYPIPNEAWSLIPGSAGYDFYYTSGLYLYGFKLGEEEPVRILNWMDCDINGDSMNGNSVSVREDGSIVGVISEYYAETTENQIFTISRVPADSLPKKEILTVAQIEYSNYELNNRIIRFNRSHDDVRLEIKDYSLYNTEEDYSIGMTKFMTEVTAGNIPDIIPMSSLSYKQLAAKGVLEDLYPYIDADRDLKREDFFPNLLAALEVGGGLYQVTPAFSVETLVGASSIVGDTPGWTYEEFNEALQKMPEGCTPLEPYITRDTVLSSLLYADMDSYVDWSTGQVRFDSDDFKQLLQFAKEFPADFAWDGYEETESTEERVMQGKQMLMQSYLYSLDSLLYNNMTFGGSSTYIGWPTSRGVGSIMRIDTGYAMSSKCSNKEAAWEFLRGMLTEEGQADVYMIPSNRNVFDAKLKDLMTPKYFTNADGSYVLDENGERVQQARGQYIDNNGELQNIYCMTQEQADQILSVIETCTKVANYDTSIFDIVNEQAQAFFADQKSIDDVVRLIQSKANIYVNEQR